MATPVIMPRQGNTVESCIISKWHKNKGDKINTGDLLFTYETDKASFDEESQVEGILLDIFFDVDDEVPVLTNVCVIGKEGENTESFRPGTAHSEIKASLPDKPEIPVQKITVQKPFEISGEIKASPRAKALADRENVKLSDAEATGPNGRIIERDVAALAVSGQKATASAKEIFLESEKKAEGTGIGGRVTSDDLKKDTVTPVYANDYEDIKLPNIRKVIAKAMMGSLMNSAQLTLNTSFDATDILDLRKHLKEDTSHPDTANINLNDIILFAAAKTLKKHKALNAHFLDDKIRYFKSINLGIAVDTDRGLLVPTLFGAGEMKLSVLASSSKDLIKQAQSGTIHPDKLSGATFTLTNLGTLGIESFTPVINPPQTGILGINNITYRQKKTDNGFVTYPAMGLSLTFDHRALDGAPAARFLKDLTYVLENIVLLLI